MEMQIENLQELAMEVILKAGAARNMINEATASAEENDFIGAESKIKLAKAELALAHNRQTRIIQAEANGEMQPYSILFSHAQDTLMVVMSELNTARRLISLCKKIDERLSELE